MQRQNHIYTPVNAVACPPSLLPQGPRWISFPASWLFLWVKFIHHGQFLFTVKCIYQGSMSPLTAAFNKSTSTRRRVCHDNRVLRPKRVQNERGGRVMNEACASCTRRLRHARGVCVTRNQAVCVLKLSPCRRAKNRTHNKRHATSAWEYEENFLHHFPSTGCVTLGVCWAHADSSPARSLAPHSERAA